MKQLEVRLLAQALDDLTGIFEYVLLRSGSETVAEGYVRRLRAACDRIGSAAEAGRPRGDLLRGLRIWSFERRVTIAYWMRNEIVEIAGLFYGGRDWERRYRVVGSDEGKP